MDAPGHLETGAPEADPQTNVDRLLGHLLADSLAVSLVQAARDVDPDQNPSEAMKAVIQERLEQAKVPRDTAED